MKKEYFVNIEHISIVKIVFLLLKFSRYMFAEVITQKKTNRRSYSGFFFIVTEPQQEMVQLTNNLT